MRSSIASGVAGSSAKRGAVHRSPKVSGASVAWPERRWRTACSHSVSAGRRRRGHAMHRPNRFPRTTRATRRAPKSPLPHRRKKTTAILSRARRVRSRAISPARAAAEHEQESSGAVAMIAPRSRRSSSIATLCPCAHQRAIGVACGPRRLEQARDEPLRRQLRGDPARPSSPRPAYRSWCAHRLAPVAAGRGRRHRGGDRARRCAADALEPDSAGQCSIAFG